MSRIYFTKDPAPALGRFSVKLSKLLTIIQIRIEKELVQGASAQIRMAEKRSQPCQRRDNGLLSFERAYCLTSFQIGKDASSLHTTG
jgi:hypothetical protein